MTATHVNHQGTGRRHQAPFEVDAEEYGERAVIDQQVEPPGRGLFRLVRHYATPAMTRATRSAPCRRPSRLRRNDSRAAMTIAP